MCFFASVVFADYDYPYDDYYFDPEFSDVYNYQDYYAYPRRSVNPDYTYRPREVYQTPVRGELYYSVQVGAFVKYANAEKLYYKLTEKGFIVYLTDTDRYGRRLTRVRVGWITDYSDAKVLLKTLKKAGISGFYYQRLGLIPIYKSSCII